MDKTKVAASPMSIGPHGTAKLLRQYGCGPVEFTGNGNALYERHLALRQRPERDRQPAHASDSRPSLAPCGISSRSAGCSPRRRTIAENPKRVYYLSMEFLIGRSLANNVTNLLLDQLAAQAVKQKKLDWLGLLEQEPDAGLGNGGLGRLAACFLDSMATMQLPAMGYGLRYEYGMFRQSIEDGWQHEQPDNWLRRPDPWEVARPHEAVEIKLNCSFEVRGGTLARHRWQAVQSDRHSRSIARWWATAAKPSTRCGSGPPPHRITSTFSDSAAAISSVRWPRRWKPNRSRACCIRTTPRAQGQGLRFVQEYFLVACSLADLVRRFRRSNTDWNLLPEKVAIQLNDTHPSMAVPELMRILLDEAHLGWDQAWDLTQRTLAYTNHTLLPEALEKWPVAWFEMLLPRHLEIIFEINRRLLDVGSDPLPRRRGPRRAREPDRGGPDQARPHG